MLSTASIIFAANGQKTTPQSGLGSANSALTEGSVAESHPVFEQFLLDRSQSSSSAKTTPDQKFQQDLRAVSESDLLEPSVDGSLGNPLISSEMSDGLTADVTNNLVDTIATDAALAPNPQLDSLPTPIHFATLIVEGTFAPSAPSGPTGSANGESAAGITRFAKQQSVGQLLPPSTLSSTAPINNLPTPHLGASTDSNFAAPNSNPSHQVGRAPAIQNGQLETPLEALSDLDPGTTTNVQKADAAEFSDPTLAEPSNTQTQGDSAAVRVDSSQRSASNQALPTSAEISSNLGSAPSVADVIPTKFSTRQVAAPTYPTDAASGSNTVETNDGRSEASPVVDAVRSANASMNFDRQPAATDGELSTSEPLSSRAAPQAVIDASQVKQPVERLATEADFISDIAGEQTSGSVPVQPGQSPDLLGDRLQEGLDPAQQEQEVAPLTQAERDPSSDSENQGFDRENQQDQAFDSRFVSEPLGSQSRFEFDPSQSQRFVDDGLLTVADRSHDMPQVTLAVDPKIPVAPSLAGATQGSPGSVESLIQTLDRPVIETIVETVATQTARQFGDLEQGQTQRMTLKIHPEELGSLEIRVESVAEIFRAQIVASEYATSELLNREKAVLHSALHELNIDVGDLEITHQEDSMHQQSSHFADDDRSFGNQRDSGGLGATGEDTRDAKPISKSQPIRGDSNLNLIA